MKEIVAVVLYLCAAFLTFGHVFNAAISECQQESYPEICERFTGPWPVAAGAFWPAYWAGRGAIAVTRPAAPVSREETIKQTSEAIGDLFDEFLGK